MNLTFRPSLTRAGPVLVLLAVVDIFCLILGRAILGSPRPAFSGILLLLGGVGIPAVVGLFFALTRVSITDSEVGYRNLLGLTVRVPRARVRGAESGFAPQPVLMFRDLDGRVVFKINTKLWSAADISAMAGAVGGGARPAR